MKLTLAYFSYKIILMMTRIYGYFLPKTVASFQRRNSYNEKKFKRYYFRLYLLSWSHKNLFPKTFVGLKVYSAKTQISKKADRNAAKRAGKKFDQMDGEGQKKQAGQPIKSSTKFTPDFFIHQNQALYFPFLTKIAENPATARLSAIL